MSKIKCAHCGYEAEADTFGTDRCVRGFDPKPEGCGKPLKGDSPDMPRDKFPHDGDMERASTPRTPTPKPTATVGGRTT